MPTELPSDLPGPAGGQRTWTRDEVLAAVRALRSTHTGEAGPGAGEGLRARKKRVTREQISDVATWMFCARGFDAVRIAEVAAEVGVSEKTVYNYFPTKESLVLDRVDELDQAVRRALRDRQPSVTAVDAIVALIDRELAHYALVDTAAEPIMLEFGRLIERTPALRSEMRAMLARLTETAAEELARDLGVDPHEPEPQIAARGLIALWDVHMGSRRRHILDGITGVALRDAVRDDIRRAAAFVARGLEGWNPRDERDPSDLAATATTAAGDRPRHAPVRRR